jgi:hypothetical protein
MASRSEARRGTDGRSKRDGFTHARWIFTAAALLTAVWLAVLILLARWLIVTVF